MAFTQSCCFAAGLVLAIGYLVEAILCVLLAILIRRGSVKALVFTGFLFIFNIVVTLFGPSWEDARGILLPYLLLLGVFVRYIRRERRADVQES